MRNLKIALIGTGALAKEKIAPIVGQIRGVQIVAVSDSYGPAMEAFASRHPNLDIARYSSLAEMFENEKLDGVIISTPSGTHADSAIVAMRAGVPPLVEKPLDVTREAIGKILKTESETGVPCSAIFQNRFAQPVAQIQKALSSGRLGSLTSIVATLPWYRSDDYYSGWKGTWELDGGGAVMNQGVHQLDLMLYFARAALGLGIDDRLIENTSGSVSNIGHKGLIETEDTALVDLSFYGGAVGTLFSTTNQYPGGNWTIEVGGSKGTVRIEEGLITKWQFANVARSDSAMKLQVMTNQATLLAASGAAMGGGSDPMAIPDEPHRLNIAAWLKSVRNKTLFEIPARDAMQTVSCAIDFYDVTRARDTLPRKA